MLAATLNGLAGPTGGAWLRFVYNFGFALAAKC
jgi:hypothetical protein